jgi:glutamyl-tRNA synthetase
MKEFYPITIAGVKRELKLCPLNEKLYIGAFVIIGDPELTEKAAGALLEKAPEYAKGILAIGRGGNKSRKDFGTWCEVKPFISFFYPELFVCEEAIPGDFSKEDIENILCDFLNTYDSGDDQNVWFGKVKEIGAKYGFCPDVKAYKASPEGYKGHVGDVSTFIRVAVTGRTNSPDLYAVMQLMGKELVENRIKEFIENGRNN